MSNGIHIDVVIKEPSEEIKFVLTMFLNDTDKTWIEFDKAQIDALIHLLVEKRSKYYGGIEIMHDGRVINRGFGGGGKP